MAHVRRRSDRFYAVVYEGLDPVTGKEIRKWHPAGTDRSDAERLATKLAATEATRLGAVRSLTFGAYLTSQWLPAKKLHLATSTFRGYERIVQLHVLPTLGKVQIRKLRYQQIEALYEQLLHPKTGAGMSPKTVYEIHLVIRGALADARRRGLVTRNVADIAKAPKQRHLQKTEGTSLTDDELRQLMRTAAGHRLFPLYWLTANTGMRRNEVLGLRWPDIDFRRRKLHLNRGLVAVGYEVHETRGKGPPAGRSSSMTRRWPCSPGGVPTRPASMRRSGSRTPSSGCSPTATASGSSACGVRGVPADRRQRRRAHHEISRSEAYAREPANPGRHPREGGKRTARSRQHRVHDADLPAPPARHARRRRGVDREAHEARSPGETDSGERRGKPRRKTA